MNRKSVGRPVVPVVLVTEIGEYYFPSMKDAALQLKEAIQKKASLNSIAALISLSTIIEGRKVYGYKYRRATQEEIDNQGVR